MMAVPASSRTKKLYHQLQSPKWPLATSFNESEEGQGTNEKNLAIPPIGSSASWLRYRYEFVGSYSGSKTLSYNLNRFFLIQNSKSIMKSMSKTRTLAIRHYPHRIKVSEEFRPINRFRRSLWWMIKFLARSTMKSVSFQVREYTFLMKLSKLTPTLLSLPKNL